MGTISAHDNSPPLATSCAINNAARDAVPQKQQEIGMLNDAHDDQPDTPTPQSNRIALDARACLQLGGLRTRTDQNQTRNAVL